MARSAGASVQGSPPDVAPPPASAAPAPARPARRYVLLAAGVLVAVQLAVRWWMLDQRGLYADDLEYATLSHEAPLLSAEFLLGSQEGHFMPAALLLAGTLSHLFPLGWTAVAVTLLLLQLLASYAVLRLLRTVMGDRPALLVPLAVYLFSPLGLGSFTWWAAAMNSVPLQIGLAWYTADALRLARTGRLRHAVSGTVALALALAFYERAVLVPVLAGALVWLLLSVEGVRAPLRAALRRAGALWGASLLVLAGWAWLFLSRDSAEPLTSPSVDQTLDLTGSFARNLVEGVAGGPWSWSPQSGPPLADAPDALFPIGAAVLAALVVWTSWRYRSGVLAWLLLGGYVVLGAVLVSVGRADSEFSAVLPLTYRYFATEAVVVAVVLAVLFVLPPRASAPSPAGPGPTGSGPDGDGAAGRRAGRLAVPVVVVGLLGAVLAGSAVSTVAYMRAWEAEPTRDYLATARAALASAGEEPLLDQEVPPAVLWALAAPYNRASRVFLPLDDRPEFADATYDLRMLDDAGRLAPARIIPGVPVRPGPVAGCGWPVPAGAATTVPLEASLPGYDWTAELTYTAAAAGDVRVALGDGEPVRVPVRAGEHTVHLRLDGAGDTLRMTGATDGMRLCIASGLVGEVEPG